MNRRLLGSTVVALAAFAIALVWFAAPRAAAADPSVRVGELTTSEGLSGSVAIEALDIAAPGLSAWTLDISYDASVVTVKGCAAEFGGLCNAEFGEETLRLSGVRVEGLEGDTVLGSIELTCTAEGVSPLGVEIVVLADATIGDPQTIAADAVAGSVTCLAEGTEPPPTPTPTPEPDPEPEKLLGDADCSGEVTAIDAALVLQFSAGLLLELSCQDAADVNGDGTPDAIDAALILQDTAGLL